MADTQRRFAVMGANTFKIADKIMSNQRICRLLKYQVRNPFSPDLKDVDGAELINKQILIVPKIYDGSNEKMSYVTAIVDDFVVNQINPEFKISTVRFDIACPYDEWLLDDTSLRPYLIMEELDRLRKDDKFNAYYDAEKVNEMTRETAYLEGIDKGKLAGEREKQIEIARSLLGTNLSKEEISKHTGLSLEEINLL